MNAVKPRIVLLDSNEDSRAMIRSILEEACVIVGEAEDGSEGMRLIEELRPELILLDLEVPQLDGIQITRRIRAAFPEMVVLVCSHKGNLETIRAVLAAGARDFVKKPLQATELLTAVLDSVTLQRRRNALLKASHVPAGSGLWAFSRAIGGAGQTTLLLGLANELVTLRKKVLLVDMHPHFGHLGFFLGLDSKGPDIADLAEFPSELTVGTVGDLARSHPSGLKVICSPHDMVRGHSMDVGRLVHQVLELPKLFDYVLVDLPSGVPDPLLPILDAARFLFLVSNGSLSSLKNTKELFELFRQLEYPAAKLRPVLVEFQGEKSIQDAFAKVMERVSPGVLKRLPEDENRVREAVGLGQPITRVFPKSPYTQAVRRSLVPLLEVSPAQVGVKESPGIFSSLFGRLFTAE